VNLWVPRKFACVVGGAVLHAAVYVISYCVEINVTCRYTIKVIHHLQGSQ
jgi:hypothetical protein